MAKVASPLGVSNWSLPSIKLKVVFSTFVGCGEMKPNNGKSSPTCFTTELLYCTRRPSCSRSGLALSHSSCPMLPPTPISWARSTALMGAVESVSCLRRALYRFLAFNGALEGPSYARKKKRSSLRLSTTPPGRPCPAKNPLLTGLLVLVLALVLVLVVIVMALDRVPVGHSVISRVSVDEIRTSAGASVTVKGWPSGKG